jgi:hypothetical protein
MLRSAVPLPRRITMEPRRASMSSVPVALATTRSAARDSVSVTSPRLVKTRTGPVPSAITTSPMSTPCPAVRVMPPSPAEITVSRTRIAPTACTSRLPLPVQTSGAAIVTSPAAPGDCGSVRIETSAPASSARRIGPLATVKVPDPSGGVTRPGDVPPGSPGTMIMSRGSSSQVPPSPP